MKRIALLLVLAMLFGFCAVAEEELKSDPAWATALDIVTGGGEASLQLDKASMTVNTREDVSTMIKSLGEGYSLVVYCNINGGGNVVMYGKRSNGTWDVAWWSNVDKEAAISVLIRIGKQFKELKSITSEGAVLTAKFREIAWRLGNDNEVDSFIGLLEEGINGDESVPVASNSQVSLEEGKTFIGMIGLNDYFLMCDLENSHSAIAALMYYAYNLENKDDYEPIDSTYPIDIWECGQNVVLGFSGFRNYNVVYYNLDECEDSSAIFFHSLQYGVGERIEKRKQMSDLADEHYVADKDDFRQVINAIQGK